MKEKTYSIGELADAVAITRRAVHFYIQQGLLQPPDGKGRGASYNIQHVERLKEILSLQQAGHSLAAIAQLLRADTGKAPWKVARITAEHEQEPSQLPAPPLPVSGKVSAQLLIRVRIAEGVELNLDAARYRFSGEALARIRAGLLDMLEQEKEGNRNAPDS